VGLFDTPAVAEVLALVTGLLLVDLLGQICFFFVKTSQYSFTELFQYIWVLQL
jgi:hypothetical protein